MIDAYGQAANTSRANIAASAQTSEQTSEQTKEIEKLKKDLGKPFASHYRTYPNGFHVLSAAMKAQARSQAEEYDRLADRYNKETGQPVSDKRTD